MVWKSISRVLLHRKIETLTLSVIAAISALGIVASDAEPVALSHVPAAFTRTAIGAAAGTRVSTAKPTARLDLPNLQHPRVDSWIKRFTTDLRGSYATYLDRKDIYDDMILKKLASRGMPEDLIYLAMIESGFNPKAKSPVKASGLWQFMAATAKRFGLTVNRRVDERNNPARATDAALKYLAALHDRFGSWYLAAAAYNSGEGTVSKALKKVTGKTKGTDADFYRILPKLPRETRDYVPKLIAAARIGKDPARYGFSAD